MCFYGLGACAMMTTAPQRTETERWRREKCLFRSFSRCAGLAQAGSSYALGMTGPVQATYVEYWPLRTLADSLNVCLGDL